MQESLDQLVNRIDDLATRSCSAAWRSAPDGTWFLRTGHDLRLHLFRRGTMLLLGQSERGAEEELYFETSAVGAMERFIVNELCMILRGRNGNSFLVVARPPLTEQSVAPGFTLTREGHLAKLSEDSTGLICRGEFTDLIKFSYIAKMSLTEIQDAYTAPRGLPPFFPL
ncbi:Imm61 family immunity protein [Paenarthrobacter sp. NPDC089714]|uniref:Imm61 family immunity protein n=1 Tax=Paenarthrobacter sp. NPDC089714 TaxID=3364377 RepID=UPI003820A363